MRTTLRLESENLQAMVKIAQTKLCDSEGLFACQKHYRRKRRWIALSALEYQQMANRAKEELGVITMRCGPTPASRPPQEVTQYSAGGERLSASEFRVPAPDTTWNIRIAGHVVGAELMEREALTPVLRTHPALCSAICLLRHRPLGWKTKANKHNAKTANERFHQ